MTSAPAAKVLSSGTPATDDPQFGLVKSFRRSQVGRTVRDGEEVRLGQPHADGHGDAGPYGGSAELALGQLRWRRVPDDRLCRQPDAISNDTYRFSDHPAFLAAFRASIAKIAASPCEILLTPHPRASHMPTASRSAGRCSMRMHARPTRQTAQGWTSGWRRKLRRRSPSELSPDRAVHARAGRSDRRHGRAFPVQREPACPGCRRA